MNRAALNSSSSEGAIPGVAAVIMAAGLGTRMRSKQVKVMHRIAGRPMVLYVLDLAFRVAGERVAVVVGHQAELVRQTIEEAAVGRDVAVVEQREQLGTGHAVLQSQPIFAGAGRPPCRVLILNGDTPLLRESTVRELLRVHERDGATVTLLTAMLDDATGYGRVLRRNLDDGASVRRIVEDRDAGPEERAIREVNVGTYVVDGAFLFDALEKLTPHNAQGEYYLTDIIETAVTQGRGVSAVVLSHAGEGLGVNTRAQLAEAERTVREHIRQQWLNAGVTMIDPASTWIDAGVTIGRDTVLHPSVTLEGRTAIGEECVVRSHTRISDCVLGNGVEILDHCVFHDSRIEDSAVLGPFVHLRPGVHVHRKAKVGNFVEMKKTDLGEGSKANHLSYLGDATIGKGVNIGAGTITCNYDGIQKYQTVIEDEVFLGSDTQLVAPVTVGARAVIAAGTTVTEDVPPDALAIARAPQVNREGWAARRRALLAEESQARNAPKPAAKADTTRRKKRR